MHLTNANEIPSEGVDFNVLSVRLSDRLSSDIILFWYKSRFLFWVMYLRLIKKITPRVLLEGINNNNKSYSRVNFKNIYFNKHKILLNNNISKMKILLTQFRCMYSVGVSRSYHSFFTAIYI